jgi:hypothetical protein
MMFANIAVSAALFVQDPSFLPQELAPERYALYDRKTSRFGWSSEPAFSNQGESYIILLYNDVTAYRFVNIRTIARRARVIDGVVEIMWTDTRSCPALSDVIWKMSLLIVPSFDVPGTSTRPSPSGAGGSYIPPRQRYTIWGYGRQPDDGPAYVTVNAVTGLISDWSREAEIALETCWTYQEPQSQWDIPKDELGYE